ncbi:secreted protein [Melampsora americana]|nr:secreted protein [Melampsora americana]
MSSKPANAIFFVLLVFLFAGDFGLQIFADASAIECNVFWYPPENGDTNKQHKCGSIDDDGVRTSYWCDSCHRNDKKLPTARECIGPRKLSSTGAFACDAGMDENRVTQPDRPIFCNHYTSGGNYQIYNCKNRQLNQQCPSNTCKPIT